MFLNLLNAFEIQDFNCLYSDAHCPTYLAINIRDVPLNPAKIDQGTNDPKVKLWDERNTEAYFENFDHSKVAEISEYINSLLSKNINGDDINCAVTQIGNMFVSNAEKSFGLKRSYTSRNTRQNKPWFYSDCRKARNIYHNARKLYNRHNTSHYKNILKIVCEDYKRTISNSVKKYKGNKVQRIKQLRSKGPRDFWKIINSVDKKEELLVPLEKLHDYFSSANNPIDTEITNETNDGNNVDQQYLQNINEEVNKPIGETEILTAIKYLNNIKSHGIGNVYLNSTTSQMLPIYVTLFNIILDSPESWALGEVLSIYENKGDKSLQVNYRPVTLLSCFSKLFTSKINKRLTDFIRPSTTYLLYKV